LKRPAGFKPSERLLSPDEVAKGMELAVSNARDLIKSAVVLFGAGLFAQTAALAILATEEVQKTFILLDLLLAANEAEAVVLWAQYRRHSPKQMRLSKWLHLSLSAEKNPTLSQKEIESLLADPTLGENVLELKKQLYLYTDNFEGSGWSLPSARATREDASKALALTESALAHTTLYSGAELGIWRKHLVGIDHKSKADKRSTLLAFFTELQSNGFQKPRWLDVMLTHL
jgi:AbiV family abortive infection protein